MPSPFPGMDPYLEAPDIWPDFHDRLATEISTLLNAILPPPYYARLEMRPEIGIAEENRTVRRIVPDVAVVHSPGPARGQGGVAVLDSPRTEISQYVEIQISANPIRHAYVEIRDPSRGHHLVTLLEIVSPSNKQYGSDRLTYQRKQSEVLQSDANLIELDLLRGGERLIFYLEVAQLLALREPPPDYVVMVNRSWRRADGAPACQLFPSVVTEPLPVIPVPLRQNEKESPLDLQYVFRRAYDSGPYRRGAVDYASPPRPPLPQELTAWAEECIRSAGLR